jgi:hypothetical protein
MIHRETRNNAVYATGVLNNLQSWQQKVDARLDELHKVAMGLQQKLGCVLDILRTFPAQAHGLNGPPAPGMASPYGYTQQWGPPMGAPNYAPGPGGPSFAAQPFGANMNPALEMALSAPSQPTSTPEPNRPLPWPLRLRNNLSQQHRRRLLRRAPASSLSPCPRNSRTIRMTSC